MANKILIVFTIFTFISCDNFNSKYTIKDSNGNVYFTNEYKKDGNCIVFKCNCEPDKGVIYHHVQVGNISITHNGLQIGVVATKLNLKHKCI